MAEFNTFIKLHRSILESAVFMDAEVLRLWIYLLCRASIEDREIIFDGKVVHLKKGQLVTGRKKLAENIGTSESKVYRSLKLLEELRCITIKVNSKFSLVTIENWAKFQDAPQKVNSTSTAYQQHTNSRATAERQHINSTPTAEQHKKRIKELNNYKECKRMIEDAPDHSTEKQKLKILEGELGGGVVLLSEEQFESLCDVLSIEELNKYISIIRDCELSGKHYKKTHYQAICEMVEKDRKTI